MVEVASWFIPPGHAALAGEMGTSHMSEDCRHSRKLPEAGYQAVKWDGIKQGFFWKNSICRIAVQMLANNCLTAKATVTAQKRADIYTEKMHLTQCTKD